MMSNTVREEAQDIMTIYTKCRLEVHPSNFACRFQNDMLGYGYTPMMSNMLFQLITQAEADVRVRIINSIRQA